MNLTFGLPRLVWDIAQKTSLEILIRNGSLSLLESILLMVAMVPYFILFYIWKERGRKDNMEVELLHSISLGVSCILSLTVRSQTYFFMALSLLLCGYGAGYVSWNWGVNPIDVHNQSTFILWPPPWRYSITATYYSFIFQIYVHTDKSLLLLGTALNVFFAWNHLYSWSRLRKEIHLDPNTVILKMYCA